MALHMDGWAIRAGDAARDLVALVRFFSRLPVPFFRGDAMVPPDMPRAMRLVPLAGLVVALPAALVVIAAGHTRLPGLAVALLALAASGLATGFLHEDGLADTADGLLGGITPERRLEIMKDSRIGAFGSIALMLVLLLKAVLIAALLANSGPWGAAGIVLAAASASRAAIAVLWSLTPSARPGGLADRLGAPTGQAAVTALLLAALTAMLLAVPFTGMAPALLGAALAILAVAGLRLAATSLIGGQTGDILGAAQQLAEIFFLIGLLA